MFKGDLFGDPFYKPKLGPELDYIFKGEEEDKSKMTLQVFREHNTQIDRLSGKSISKSTAKRYWTCFNHIEQFNKEVYKADDYRMKDIHHQFINNFEYF